MFSQLKKSKTMVTKASIKRKQVKKAGSGTKVKASTKGGKGKEKNDRYFKAPSEAAAYLKEWESQDDNLSAWKFNKNTQSWLIRHMYEIEKVSKSSFTTLLKYLEGLKGDSARSRIRSEASRRALRYKDHQEMGRTELAATSAGPGTTGEGREDGSYGAKSSLKTEDVYEEERWKKLSEHDKRKEYKRARKVLETVV